MKKPKAVSEEESVRRVPQLTGPQLEVMSVLWQMPRRALKLSEIHELIVQRRRRHGEPIPAPTTISSTLRMMAAYGLLVEGRWQSGEFVALSDSKFQSTLYRTRSPNTAYQAGCGPSEAMMPIFQVIINAYPLNQRCLAILDMATALSLEREVIDKMRQLLPEVI